jgi:hypothetical protein
MNDKLDQTHDSGLASSTKSFVVTLQAWQNALLQRNPKHRAELLRHQL